MPQNLLYNYSGILTVGVSGEMNSLTNNSLRLSTVDFVNTSGYPFAEIRYQDGAATSYAASTAISMWMLRSIATSGTYEAGASGVQPARAPDVVLPLASGLRAVVNNTALPFGFSRLLVKNDGTGVTLPASGNLIYIQPYTYAMVSG